METKRPRLGLHEVFLLALEFTELFVFLHIYKCYTNFTTVEVEKELSVLCTHVIEGFQNSINLKKQNNTAVLWWALNKTAAFWKEEGLQACFICGEEEAVGGSSDVAWQRGGWVNRECVFLHRNLILPGTRTFSLPKDLQHSSERNCVEYS